MKWERGHRSDDVEVRRGGVGGGGPMMGMALAMIARRFGWKGMLLALGIFFVASRFMGGGSSDERVAGNNVATQQAQSDERVQFVSFVLDDVQDTWTNVFSATGQRYERAKMVLFEDATQTGCGYGQAATGPFYCPLDRTVYLDLGFFRELERLGGKGDFAQAYVIAHEVGHHVQNLLGNMDRARGSARDQRGASGSSVRLELQADCLAGVWAKSTAKRDLLEQGDLDEALTTAASIGDDRLQRRSQGTVQPESWTHGSSAQRSAWFRRGFEGGDVRSCDTFASS